MSKLIKYIILMLVLVFSAQAFSQVAREEKKPVKTKILFILDASGSMFDKMGDRIRIDVAKEVLTKLVDSLRDQPNLELALRVYGHQYAVKYQNCNDTKLEVPFGKNNHDGIIEKIKSITPQGTTLIANSLQHAAEDFGEFDNTRNVIVLITDGIEACGGDPCALSIALQKRGIFLKPFIIGLAGNSNFDKAFNCMGQYFDASDETTFKRVLGKVMTQTLLPTTVKVKLLDEKNQPTETDVNITFINQVTGKPEYDFVHYLDSKGQPDELDVDPILSYDLVVNTIPKVVKRNVYLEGGQENVIYVKTPQGFLEFKGNLREYKSLPAIIKENGTGKTIHVQNVGTLEKYLVGTYDIELLTVPRLYFNDVKIQQSKTTSIDVVQPGVLNIVESLEGFGSIYKLNSDGSQEWVMDLENNNSKTTLAMQPGEYKLVFRSQRASGSHLTDVQTFVIRSGLTTALRIFKQ